MWEMFKFVSAEGDLFTSICVIGAILGVLASVISGSVGQIYDVPRKWLVTLSSLFGLLVAGGVTWKEVDWRYNSFAVMTPSAFNEKVVKKVTPFKGTVTCVAAGLKIEGVYTMPEVEITQDIKTSVNVALDTVDTDYKTACSQNKYLNSADQLDGSLRHSAHSQIEASKSKMAELFTPSPPVVNLSSTGDSSLERPPVVPNVKKVAVTLDNRNSPTLVSAAPSSTKPAVDISKSISGQ